MVTSPHLLAAVDLGSNSFRLIVGRVEETPAGSQIYPVDALREPVRLAAGLSSDKMLDRASQERGWEALKRFGERLRDFHPDHVRAVATNTLRVAKNAGEFLGEAEAALGFPIEVIAGREEARLIYAGAAHSVPASAGKRLVVDIGGGSTEFIIGSHYTPIVMESLYIGCVSHSRAFFPAGNVDEYTMRQAELAAKREIQIISSEYKKAGWDQAIGSSGTARALAELVEANGFNDPGITHGISRGGLERLKRALIKSENVNRLKLIALKPDRVPVLAGGLAIMLAVFEELGVDYVDTTDGALRLGVLYDLLGRTQHEDMRAVTVEGFTRRYGVDRAQAGRIGTLAGRFYDELDESDDEAREEGRMFLGWAAALHEIGLSISHSAYHKHSAYIASNADMPGFSRTDQARLAALVLGHAGKLGKLSQAREVEWPLLFCLRLAALLCRRRTDAGLPDISVSQMKKGGYEVRLPSAWVEQNPLTDYSLSQEAAEWEKVGIPYRVVYTGA
ncbi:exopolyphosphatase [Burkholderia sp. Bp9017]|uniref:Exopolyphosphatase n=1 Tax=Burkholderia anthina TaxID=179879 RepID=A0A7T6VH32_9BURK|nr:MULTISPECIES: exopolyphosphatase [Burkholderia]MBY4869901.1 exopolyphosphatase [Burkholderia anthina]QQK03785.1 exopolyphosphatase [Burkholderia anthina]RQZ23409.1 exopolyphosphatase [Burkholderia sp. Bp9017]RQZ31060.1 exopolyphosphatase [Burkholderia sp. Bp9016]